MVAAGEGADAKAAPVTEVITSESGAALRRIRKLRIQVQSSQDAHAVGRAFTFAQDEVRVGSHPDADVPVSDASVSREHLAIRLGRHGFMLTDVGSTNGTFLGGLRIDKVHLASEAVVTVGKTHLLVTPLSESVDQEISPRAHFGRMIGASAAMREMFALLERAAPSDLTVLVEGETGTGKELCAEAIHESSGRSGRLVSVNCGAIPRELIESELFGHEKGAFTGAIKDRAGAFAMADGGTLFLDEVGELPLDMQAKLLRALERREIKPVGSDRMHNVDVRVVAATNRSLPREVQDNAFRQDLYYRLAVVVVRVPPLRTRLEDLRLLIDHIQDQLARRRVQSGLTPLPRLDAEAISMLERYDFPGNVRELRNLVERWVVLGADVDPLARSMGTDAASGGANANALQGLLALPYHEAKDAWVERFERAFTSEALAKSGGNVSKAARDAGVDRRHLQRLMARFSIRSPGRGDGS